MPGIYFFAVREDLRQVLDFIFAETDFHVLEHSSEYEQPLREFASFDQLDAICKVGQDKFGNGSKWLSLWSPSVIRNRPVRRIKLNPEFCDGFTFRYTMDGAGVAVLMMGGVHGRIVTRSHFNHFSREGAAKWGKAGGIDWKSFFRLSNRIRYHISKRLEVAHLPGISVLPAAYKLYLKGYKLKPAAGATATYWLGEN
jgi:hypothetical protein